MNNSVGIAIFAKAPIEGFVKTRLIPSIGAKRAADLQRFMIELTVQTAIESGVGPVSLWCTPDCNHHFFSKVAAKFHIERYTQSGSDLGARMLDAFDVLTANYPVILIGCDCLVLQPTHLEACAAALHQGHDAVFIPTEDGGYALIAAEKPWPELFGEMPWGSSEVMAKTRLRARQIELRCSEPLSLWDLDTPADYERAMALGLLQEPLPELE